MPHHSNKEWDLFSETPLSLFAQGGDRGGGGEWGLSPTCTGVWRVCSFFYCSSCCPRQTYYEGCLDPRSDSPCNIQPFITLHFSIENIKL